MMHSELLNSSHQSSTSQISRFFRQIRFFGETSQGGMRHPSVKPPWAGEVFSSNASDSDVDWTSSWCKSWWIWWCRLASDLFSSSSWWQLGSEMLVKSIKMFKRIASSSTSWWSFRKNGNREKCSKLRKRRSLLFVLKGVFWSTQTSTPVSEVAALWFSQEMPSSNNRWSSWWMRKVTLIDVVTWIDSLVPA